MLPKRIGIPGRRRRRTKNTFTSYFEEKKALEYLRNLINSRFLTHETEGLFTFSWTVFGEKTIFDLIKRKHPELLKRRQFKEAVEMGLPDADMLSASQMEKFLQNDIAALVSKKLTGVSSCPDFDTDIRLSTLKKTFDLTNEEIELVSFFYLMETFEKVGNALKSNIADFADISVLRNHGDILFGLDRGSFLSSVAKGTLFKAEIIEKRGGNSLEITSWCVDYLSGLTKVDLSHEFFSLGNDETLEISDFNIPEDDMLVLDTMLKSNGRQNLLLYGAPGTGKSSFARSLAKKYGKELFSVKSPETDEHKDRLRAIFATINLADKDNSIVLVDEALDKKNRLKVLKYEFRKKGLEGYLSDEELSDLCKTYNVDAGGIVNAMNTLNITSDTDKETALRKILAVLKSHEKATGGKRGANQKEREFDTYSLDGLNTSRNLGEIITALKYNENQRAIKNVSVALLLYGRPGTGKSEFVYFLGHSLGKEVILKRASDIQSMWVGESEKNIASAFTEAQESDRILFFDEADTFLFPRASAQRSWEISFTNELLTQLESYKGIVVFATNDMEGLDHAALRRFKFKIEFRPLKPEGTLHFYNKLFGPLVQEEDALSEGEIVQIKNIIGLTPGDFAVVKDQFLFVDPSAITHEKLIQALRGEVIYKKNEQGIKGFAA